MKKLFFLFFPLWTFCQTANQKVLPYNGIFGYGTNPGYYGPNWNSQNLGKIAGNLGVRTFRLNLYDDYLSTYGPTSLVPLFNYLRDSIGALDNTVFVGSPSLAHKDSATFFKGLYLPAWLDSQQTQINPSNTFAYFLYNAVKIYGSYIQFYEIINEPDFTYSPGGWAGDNTPPTSGSWFDHNPLPSELPNLKTTVFVYNRLLRIAWEVIKKLQPSAYVCTGGIGARSFLDAVLRNTDNPIDGSISPAFPLKAGAYFDCISYHVYPQYFLKQWNNAKGGFDYFRNSDFALSRGLIKVKNWMDSLAGRYGYDGLTYPKKQFILTETNISRIMDGDNLGGPDVSRNYLIKALIMAQKNAIGQLYTYQLADGPGNLQFDKMGLYEYIGNLKPGNTLNLTPQGIGFASTASLLLNRTFDPVGTAALNLPATIDGAAFKGPNGANTYVLWAKATKDTSEQGLAAYSFPNGLTGLFRAEYDYSQTGSLLPTSSTVTLTPTPSFFVMKPVRNLLFSVEFPAGTKYNIFDDRTWSSQTTITTKLIKKTVKKAPKARKKK
jgi:hypothetical protein